ncbi:MAG: TetR/AcrR family transcriptional regulator [Actinomycetota bacterium]
MPTLDLSPDQIVTVARDLIGQHGLERFSMRKLAAALDVNPMTIYLRFENKDALLAAVAAAALADFEAPPAGGTWSDQVLALAVELRRHLIADRDTLRLLHDGDRLTIGLLSAIDRGLSLMGEVHVDDQSTVEAFRVLFWHVVGSALVAASFQTLPGNDHAVAEAFAGVSDDYPHVVAHASSFGPVDADALFVRTTALLVEGLRPFS